MREENEPVTFVIPGNLHVTGRGLGNHKAAIWAIDEASQVIRPDSSSFNGGRT